MLLLAVAVLVGLVAGWLRPRLGAHTARPELSWLPLLGAGAAANLAAYLLEGRAATLALVAALALLVGFAAVNAHLTGIAVIGIGLLANFAAVVLNRGMPVRGDALVAAGVVEEGELDTVAFTGARHLETPADTLPILGDVLPVPLPVAPEVLSFGDLVVVFGAAEAVRDLARRRHRRRARASAPALHQRRGAGPARRPLDPPAGAASSTRASPSLAGSTLWVTDPPVQPPQPPQPPRHVTGAGEPARPLAARASTR